MTLKYPGATADLIATKNLFDVFLKTRVLDICGDVREKENKEKWFISLKVYLNILRFFALIFIVTGIQDWNGTFYLTI